VAVSGLGLRVRVRRLRESLRGGPVTLDSRARCSSDNLLKPNCSGGGASASAGERGSICCSIRAVLLS
jgi:hypothetical protein